MEVIIANMGMSRRPAIAKWRTIDKLKEQLEDITDCNARFKPSEKIKPMVKIFFEKLLNSISNSYWSNYYLKEIAGIAEALAFQTCDYEFHHNYWDEFTDEDLSSFIKIFNELDILFEEAMKYGPLHDTIDENNFIKQMKKATNIDNFSIDDDSLEEKYNDAIDMFRLKTIWISFFVKKNSLFSKLLNEYGTVKSVRETLVFSNYENLWKIIHRINTESEELQKKGFSELVIKDFFDFYDWDRDHTIMKNEWDRDHMIMKNEKERFEIFMKLLDGKAEIIKKCTSLSFSIKDITYED